MAFPTPWEARNNTTSRTRESIPLTLAKRAFSLTAVEKHKGDRQTNAKPRDKKQWFIYYRGSKDPGLVT